LFLFICFPARNPKQVAGPPWTVNCLLVAGGETEALRRLF
jgi:hypothetical protein